MAERMSGDENVDGNRLTRKHSSHILKKIGEKEKIMGFGHRVYRKGDPRAKHLKRNVEKLTKLTGEPKWYEMSLKSKRS